MVKIPGEAIICPVHGNYTALCILTESGVLYKNEILFDPSQSIMGLIHFKGVLMLQNSRCTPVDTSLRCMQLHSGKDPEKNKPQKVLNISRWLLWDQAWTIGIISGSCGNFAYLVDM